MSGRPQLATPTWREQNRQVLALQQWLFQADKELPDQEDLQATPRAANHDMSNLMMVAQAAPTPRSTPMSPADKRVMNKTYADAAAWSSAVLGVQVAPDDSQPENRHLAPCTRTQTAVLALREPPLATTSAPPLLEMVVTMQKTIVLTLAQFGDMFKIMQTVLTRHLSEMGQGMPDAIPACEENSERRKMLQHSLHQKIKETKASGRNGLELVFRPKDVQSPQQLFLRLQSMNVSLLKKVDKPDEHALASPFGITDVMSGQACAKVTWCKHPVQKLTFHWYGRQGTGPQVQEDAPDRPGPTADPGEVRAC
ncbi:unnamed protein product [Polarella glacialis]|uniref:Uncharacterized protein n=1 Tax=Polarella glacialis TaxID=89957 RepID=A0A813F3Q4_POLGL|nr:unnamed protein product [Polarella glacialis]